MNFPGPIDANLSSASAVSLDGEQFAFNAHSHGVDGHQGANGIIIPDKHLLFNGDYAREGNDLILSAPHQKYVVHDYFKGEKRPALISEDGATLSGHIVSSLTGHVQYAQATAPDAAQVIGHVLKLTGSASVIRNGVTVELNIGDAVQKGDVVQTGSDSSIAMTLIDGSAFGMTSNARMVLNEMVYDPNGSSNSSFISLVQGTVTFVAGQTAKNGNMRVETPVATMGIRGTAVAVKIYSETGVVETVLGIEPDGHTGGFAYYDNTTGELLGTVTQAGRVTIISPGGVGQPATATETQLSAQAALADKALFNLVYQLAFPNFNPDANPKSTDKPRTDISVPPNTVVKAGTDADGRATVTYTIQVTNPITHVTTDVQIIAVNTPPSFSVDNVTDQQATTSGLHSFKLGDQVHITDRDISAAPFFDVAVPYTTLTGHYVATGPSSINFGSYLLNSNLLSFDDRTGLVTYNPEGFRFLGKDETAIYTFSFKASSGVGSTGSDSAILTLTLTVTGQNDAPTIVAASTHHSDGVKEDVSPVSGNIQTTGLITFQDFDLTDAHTASFVHTSTSIDKPLPGFNPITTSLGTFALLPVSENLTDTNDTGSVGWTFVLNDANPTLQSLAEGQTITQTYTVTIKDSQGVSVDQLVTVTITGTNDAPVLAADTSVNHQAAEVVNVTGAASTVVDSTSGYLAFTDVDLTDTHQASAALSTGANAVVWTGGTYSGIPSATIAALGNGLTAAIGTGALNPDSTGNGAGAVKWDFSLPDNLFDFLGHSETLTLVYDVTIADYNNGIATGTSSTKQVTVQITASNDKPVITAVDVVGAVQEDANVVPVINQLHDTGSVTFADADETDHEAASVAFVSNTHSAGAMISPALHAALLSALTLQQSSYSSNTGTVNWDFNLDNGLVQYLAANETVTATYTISVKDNSGVGANDTSVPQTVTVTITGTNDAPVVSGTVSDVTAVEDSTPSVLNALANASDVDEGSSLAIVNVPGVLPAGVTYDSGSHNFTLDPGNAAYQHLAAGQQTTVTVNYGVTDGIVTTPTAAAVSWTITGTNDAPVVSAATVAAVDEDTTAPAGATVAALFTGKFTDVDDSASLKGIAIIGYTADSAKGVWEYNDNIGGGWQDIGSVAISASSAVVLSAASSLRFVPAHDFNGPAPSLTVYGIDDTFTGPFTAGTVHQVQDLSTAASHGGQTPYSAATTTIGTTITAVNDAPVATGSATLAAIDEDTTNPAGATVSSLFASHFSDSADNVAGGSTANTFAGIAITSYTEDTSKGVWQYSTGGTGPWVTQGSITTDLAIVLNANDVLRFLPAHDYNGAATPLSAILIESGAAAVSGAGWSMSGTPTGGTTHYSSATVTLGETINAVNDAPLIALGANYATFNGLSAASTPDSTVATTQTDNVTMEGWVNWNGSGGANQMLFYNGSTSTDGFGLFGANDGHGHLSFSVLSGGVTGVDLSSSIAANEWHHLALTYSSGTFNFYIDGQLAEYWTQGVNPINLGDDSIHPNNIDRTMIGGFPGVTFHSFNGSIGEVRIWNEAHNATQIDQYMNVSLTGSEANLAGYWHLNDGTGTNANDATTGNHDLTLSGGAAFATNSASGWPQTAVATAEDTSVVIGGLSISDIDAGTNQMSVSLDVDHGSLHATYNGNVIYSNSNGTLNLPLNTIAGMNAVLATLVYTPDANYNGADTLHMVVDDLGNSGSGGSQSTSLDLALNVAPVNDAPDFSGSAFGQAFVENGNPVQLVGTGGLVVHDVDNSNFAGGSFTASIGATGSHIGDLLFVAGTDHIQIVSGDVQFDADGTAGGAHFVSIGTLTNHGANLSVALNSAADAAAVMELTQAIRFSSTSDDPTSDQRIVTFTLNDGGGTANGGHDTTSFNVVLNVTPVNDAPVLVGDGLSIVHGVQSSPDYGTITKVVDLTLSDSDEGSALSTISAVAGHGTVTYFDGTTNTSLASGVSATVTDINTILHDGITYTPTSAPSTGALGDTLANTDKVTVTVTDSHGASDTINFIFQQDGAAPNAAQLTGTTGKDLIFATQHDDALTGLAGQDNFVFASTTGQHTITDFVQGQDKIDLHLLPSFDAAAVTALLTNADHPDAGHTLLHMDGIVGTILVNNPALTANDFIIHPGASV